MPGADGAAVEVASARRLRVLAAAVASAEAAPDTDGALAAVGVALYDLGLDGHVALLEPDGSGLVVRSVVLGCAGLAEVERVLGRAVVGARIGLDAPTPYRRVVLTARAERVEAPLWWARLFAPALGPREAEAIAGLIRLRDVALVPLAAGRRTLGVLTVWAPRLSGADMAAVELLGQAAGPALRRRDGRVDGEAPAPRSPTAAPPAVAVAA